jgi:hypothetical protein
MKKITIYKTKNSYVHKMLMVYGLKNLELLYKDMKY